MIKVDNSGLHLSGEDARVFWHNMLHPNEEAMKRRDAFFAEIDATLDIQRQADGTIVITSPEIILDEQEGDHGAIESTTT